MAALMFLAALLISGVVAEVGPYGQCGGIKHSGSKKCSPGYQCVYGGDWWSSCQPAPVPVGKQGPWGQCGGVSWTGATSCSAGYFCSYGSEYYSQCRPIPVHNPNDDTPDQPDVTSTAMPTTSSSTTSTTTSTAPAMQTPWGQCGGNDYSGATTCVQGWKCYPLNSPWFYQCWPDTTSTSQDPQAAPSTSSSAAMQTAPTPDPSPTDTPLTTLITLVSSTDGSAPTDSTSQSPTDATSTSSIATDSVTPSPTDATSTSSTATDSVTQSSMDTTSASSAPTVLPGPMNCSVANGPPPSAGRVAMSGVNIPGCEFGVDIWGAMSINGSYCPTGLNGWPDGPGQITHFVNDDGFNTFRIPVSWQFLINNGDTASGDLDPVNWETFDYLMQNCLITGANCLVEVHNFGRFNGQIIGQGGPSNDVFSALWSSIATKYADNSNVLFGLMNEPHDIPDMDAWAATCQAAVNAIRTAETVSHMILLPGNDWTSAGTFILDGSADALAKIKNPDGSFTDLIFEVHKYLDWDNSGTNAECADSFISDAFAPLAQWLRCNGRQAFLTEIGGGNTASCGTYLCEAIAFLNANSDVYVGYLGWGAGSFDPHYILSQTPWIAHGVWVDQWLVNQCMLPH